MMIDGKEIEPLTVSLVPVDLRLLSVVVPVYGSPQCLEILYCRLRDTCNSLGVRFELILVDDRCPKGSWEVIKKIAASDAAVVGVRLSRNFGQHAAIQAGLARVTGDWVVVMDCDLQDRPEEIPRLLEKAHEGYDIVIAVRGERKDDVLRKFISVVFYKALGFLTDTPYLESVANFGAYRRKVIDVITSWAEETKFFPAILNWVGYDHAYVIVTHDLRHSGYSSYTLRKLVQLAVQVIIGFSDKPLRLLVKVGVSIAVLTILVVVFVLALLAVGLVQVQGWASLMLSIWFLGGAILTAIGITGLYVGRILVESKGRPPYIVDETVKAD